MDTMTLSVVGAAYTASIAVGVSRRAWRQRSETDGYLALLLVCGVLAITTIAVQHRLDGGPLGALLQRVEYVATLVSGPALLLFVRGLAEAGTRRRERLVRLVHFAPAAAAAAAPAALAIPIELLVLHQVAYTCSAAAVRVRRRAAVRRHASTSWCALAILAAVHLAQAVRIAGRGSLLLVDVVPVTLSVAILCGGALGVVVWLAHGTPARRRRRRGVGHRALPAAEAVARAAGESDLLARLERLMGEDHLYRRPDLGLRELAGALGVTPHRLSDELNAVAGVTLSRYLAGFRLADAKRRLLDPAHDVVTVDAIGERSGFGSRSAFYATFRREVGTTPTRFRAAHRSPAGGRRGG